MKSNQPQLLNQTKWHTWKEVEVPSGVEALAAAAVEGAPVFGTVTAVKFSDPDKFAREKEWFLAASQGETGTKSNLNTTVSSVPDLDDEELHNWSTATLTQKGVLPNEQQRSAASGQPQQPAQ
eukprot:scaffold7286_cov110-Skeletonema_dohrnii-CCMP3373.AAC.1